jgi:eukaryotic-like serine/threonine-protein kinase
MRRVGLEVGLLVAGVAIGIVAVVLLRDESPAPAPERPAPPSMTIIWRYPTGGPIVSSPVVVDGRVFIGSHDDRVHCVDAATGAGIWTFATRDDVEAPPLVADGRVFVGSADGTLYAIDAMSGEGVWTYATPDRILGGAAFHRRPDGGATVFVGSYDQKLHAVDAATGESRWIAEADDYLNGAPAVDGDAVVFGGCDGVVRVVDALGGASLHALPLGDGVHIASSIVADRGVAFVAHVDSACVAVSIATGAVLWTWTAPDSYFSSPALSGDRVFVGGRDRHLRALDRATGKLVWSLPCRADLDGSPAVLGDRVLVGSTDGRLYAVGRERGETLWEFSFGGAISGSAAAFGDLVIVPCEDGTLYALGPKVGR